MIKEHAVEQIEQTNNETDVNTVYKTSSDSYLEEKVRIAAVSFIHTMRDYISTCKKTGVSKKEMNDVVKAVFETEWDNLE